MAANLLFEADRSFRTRQDARRRAMGCDPVRYADGAEETERAGEVYHGSKLG